MNADGSGQTRITSRASATDWFPVWSPDGSKIAFASFDCCPAGANYDIWVMNADGSSQTNITNNPAEDILPSWQPGGSKIAFQTNRDGDVEIYTMNPDGTGLTNVSNSAVSFDFDADWSPDGSRIVFASNRETIGFGVDIYVMDADGSGVGRLTTTRDDSMPAWSPDGSKIAFRSRRDFNDEIYTMNADGSGATRLTNNAPPGNTLPEDWYPDWQPLGPSDTTPPAISCSATPGTLWPPNHRLRPVSVDIAASDDSGSVTVTLVSVTSSQPESGLDHEDVASDIQGWNTGTDDRSGLLRAERFKQVRTYMLTYQAQDPEGNTAICQTTVVVSR
jgi:TolB protein